MQRNDSKSSEPEVSDEAKACGRVRLDFDSVEEGVSAMAPKIWDQLLVADAANAVQEQLNNQVVVAQASAATGGPQPDESGEPLSPEEVLWKKAR